jgi:hypothetical protein
MSRRMTSETYVYYFCCVFIVDLLNVKQRVQRESAVSAAEVDRLEAALAQARSAAMTHGVGVKTRLHALQIA